MRDRVLGRKFAVTPQGETKVKRLILIVFVGLFLASPSVASAQVQMTFLPQPAASEGASTAIHAVARPGFLTDHASFIESYTEAQRLRSFMDEGPMKSPKEYADRIRNCDKRGFRMPCEVLVSSFNEAHKDKEGIEPVKSLEELADYIKNETTMEACGGGRAEIGAVKGIAVVFIDRPFAFDEKCFRDKGTGVLISSARCGQWIRKHHPAFKAAINQKLPDQKRPGQGNSFVRGLKKIAKPAAIIGAGLGAGYLIFTAVRDSSSEAEASPKIGISIKIGG